MNEPHSTAASIHATIAVVLIVFLGIVMTSRASAQTFDDVPANYWAFSFIETLAANSITAGCGDGNYCPEDSVSRAQMAVFLERGMNGGDFIPPAATGNVFFDVESGDFAASFIEKLADDGITAGCGNNNYCPDAIVSRAQMAVFLLRAKYGSGFSPPPPVGVFADVDLSYWAVAWIEQLAAEGITAGCSSGNYCPEDPVSRAQMAVFLVRSFSLEAPTPAGLGLVRLLSNSIAPIYVTAPPGDIDRLFFVEKGGSIKILDRNTGNVNANPFLTIGGVGGGSEQGLLGLAFHPDYAANGRFYVNFTEGSLTVIREYQVSAGNPDLADPQSALNVLSYAQPQSNHNGGWIGFGSDGYLYISSGDGGAGNDSGTGHTAGTGNAQDISSNLLGKMLRVDIDADDFPGDANRNYAIPISNPFVGQAGDDEIWSFGLRNPWRASFDRATGDLFIGDVGQNAREEINVQLSSSAGGENYGWRLREGTILTPTGGVGGAHPSDAIDPIYDYSHGTGPSQGNAVIGGYVYRGPIAALNGMYFFADNVNHRIWSLEYDGSSPSEFDGTNFFNFIDWTDLISTDIGTVSNITSFGEDADGNLYVLDGAGGIFIFDSATFE
jgi:hypothetical protein